MKGRHIFLLCLALLLCCPLLLKAQSSQTNYQYWIDNNKDEAVYGTVDGEDISLSIDASALSTGIHYYNIRAYETVGSKTKWGTIYRYLFSIPESANGVPNNLSRYEYWLDNDYEHRGTTTVNGEESEALLSIDVSSLTPGIHFYNFRAQDVDGIWGTTYRYLFSIPRSANGVPNNLSRYEYWLDNDYEHRGTTTVNGEESEALLSIDVSSLTPGIHFYNFRAQDVDGIWGTTYRYLFSIPYPQQETVSKFITGYSYAFNDGATTNVVFDTPVEEYQLIKAFDVPQAQPPMVIDDDCSFVFDDEENIAKLSRNINMSFSLYFKDEAESIGSPITTDFKVEDIQTQAIQIVSIPGSATIASHENGGFGVVCFEVPTDMELLIQTDATSSLRLYSPYSQLLDSYDATTLTTGVTREFEAGTYYAVVYGNAEELTLTLGSSQICGYAILDTSTGTLTFKYGQMPDGDNVWETENTDFSITSSLKAPWVSTSLKKVVFDASYAEARPTSTSLWFSAAVKLEEITGLEYLNTSEVTNMSLMFMSCSLLTNLDVSHFNTSNVTNMNWMFSSCSSLKSINVTNFDTSNVTDMGRMFNNCSGLTSLDVSNFDTSNVTYMDNMFSNCSGLTSLDVSNFDTSNVTNMDYMFYGCSGLTSLNVSNFDTSNVTDMDYIFSNCSGLTSLNVSNFDTSNVTDMSHMFSGCSGLTSLDVSNFDTSNVTNMGSMFYGCSGLTSLNVSNFDTSNVTNMNSMFSGCSGLTSLDVSNFNTSNVILMGSMFSGCSGLKTVFAGDGWTTENVTYSDKMFDGCTNLVGGKGTKYNKLYVNKEYAHIDGGSSNPGYFTASGSEPYTPEPCGYAIFDTSTGTLTFKYGPMPEGDNVWETENTNFTIIDKAWDTNSLKAVVFDASYAEARPTSTAYWFYGAKILATITGIEYLNTSNVTNMNAMFWNCSSLTTLDVTHFDTKNVTDMTCMFMNCSNLVSLDVSYFDTKNVEQFLNTFNGCSRLTNLDVSHFNTSKAKSMAGIFSNCSNLTSIDVTNFDISNATSIGGMFNHCTALSNVDVSNFETGNVTSMSNLFYGCSSLTNIDVSHFDTRNVTFMSDMFRDCVNLTSLDLSNFNTENVLGMSYMFSGCNNLTELDVSSFDTKNVTSMSNMFANCRSLPHLDISNFNTSKVEYMSGMFWGCSSLTDIDVSHFDTRNVISLGGPKVSENGYLAGMFQGCENLTSLNLCSFNTAKVESMSLMFYGCKKLEKVYVSEEWTTENVTNADLMFANCTALVGEKGTTYSASHNDKTYARIDNAPSAPGYFTYKAPVQKGDANGDGVIDTQDAIKVVQYYLGKNPTDFNIQAADVNNDGVVDTQDAIQIIKIYLKK